MPYFYFRETFMQTKLTTKIPLILILLLTLVFAKLQFNKRLSSPSDVCMNICSDGRGYYAWLPAIFIFHDLNFGFFEQVELKSSPCGGAIGGCIQDYRNSLDGHVCNKYYPGTAFMMLPFFAWAHITESMGGYRATGYSPPYFQMIGIAGICYFLLGMLLFLAILRKLQLNILQQSLTILLIAFGSNILYFTADKPAYSHIYSFVLIGAFLYYALCLRQRFSMRHLAYLSFLTGFIFITRPVNVSIVLILPFVLWESRTMLIDALRQKPSALLALLPGFIMPCILFCLYHISTGHFFIYSYDKEGFDFLHPHFWQFLFSYDNGVFPYTPLLFLPFVFVFVWYLQTDKLLIWGAFITLLVTAYIHSSWWCWSYGLSFGARTMLDFLPLFGIIIGLSLKNTNLKKHFYLLPVYFLCCTLTMILYDRKNHGYMSVYPITDYWPAVYSGLGVKK